MRAVEFDFARKELFRPIGGLKWSFWTSRVGDYRTEDGRKLLKERSPLNFVDRIQRALLIGQGANDPRVKQNESDQIVSKMQAKNLSVTYALYSDEGHGFARPENQISFYAVAEAFLSKHLGGRYEPIGNDFNGSTIAVPAGADKVPGLAEPSIKDCRVSFSSHIFL